MCPKSSSDGSLLGSIKRSHCRRLNEKIRSLRDLLTAGIIIRAKNNGYSSAKMKKTIYRESNRAAIREEKKTA